MMKKAEIINEIANNTGLAKKDCEAVFNATFELFKNELSKGENVAVSGFGTFRTTLRAAREGRNPQTGEKISIKASKTIGFKAGKELKEKVNK